MASVLCLRPNSHWEGERPSYLGEFRYSKSAFLKASKFLVFSNKCFISRTAHSAWPFDSWWKADDNSWMMFRSWHHFLNSSLNCGPPSLLMQSGFPKSQNQSSRILIIVFYPFFSKVLHLSNQNIYQPEWDIRCLFDFPSLWTHFQMVSKLSFES